MSLTWQKENPQALDTQRFAGGVGNVTRTHDLLITNCEQPVFSCFFLLSLIALNPLRLNGLRVLLVLSCRSLLYPLGVRFLAPV